MIHRVYIAVVFTLLATACGQSEPTPAPGPPSGPVIEVAVAPLTLHGVVSACYGVEIFNEADESVFARQGICSDQFGADASAGPGAMRFSAACDASDPNDDGVATAIVALRIENLFQNDPNGNWAPLGGWTNPCAAPYAPNGCRLATTCTANTGAPVVFDLTLARRATQGFFDTAIDLDGIFCSAKVDCAYPGAAGLGTAPIQMVFDPVTGERVDTVVWAIACTDGSESVGGEATTHLYMDEVVVRCGDESYLIDPSAGPGNVYPGGVGAPPPIVQAMVFEGRDPFTSGGLNTHKLYWSVALGLNAAFFVPGVADCVLETHATATRGPLVQGETPAGVVYPVIDVSVPLNDGPAIVCSQHPLWGTGEHEGVGTSFTRPGPGGGEIETKTFGFEEKGTPGGGVTTGPTQPAVNECVGGPSPCGAHGVCQDRAAGYVCACEAQYVFELGTCRKFDECIPGVAACAVNERCVRTVTGHTCNPCPAGTTSPGGAVSACVNVDECAAGTASCAVGTVCRDTDGAYACDPCGLGMTSAGGAATACTDVDECATGTASCAVGAWCMNTVGDYRCVPCDPGMTSAGGGASACVDVDECAQGGSLCAAHADCVNTVGGYTCACSAGYEGDGVTCVDVNECGRGTANCAVGATCTNTDGGFECECKSGEFGDGVTCTPWTVCGAGTYVVAAGTATSDRVCGACAGDTYSTGTNAASCQAKTVCAAGQYVTSNGSASSDRTCGACTGDTYSTGTNAASCQAKTVCSAGQCVTSNGSASSNRTCGACTGDTYSTGTNAASCQAKTVCSAGQYVTSNGSALSDRTCGACTGDTYSAGTNAASCQAKTVCSAGQYVTSNGSASSNRTCGACTGDTYSTGTNAASCQAKTVCSAGQYVTSNGSATTDRVCGACTGETYSTGPNAASCTAKTVCSAGQYVTSNGSASSNRTCGTCAAGTYNGTQNAGSCPACPASTYSASGATACTPWTDCLPPTQGQVTAPSPTQNRVCAYCLAGFQTRYKNDPQCEDINECLATPSPCTNAYNRCDNYAGGYQCLCEDGTYDVNGNGTSCVTAMDVSVGKSSTCAVLATGRAYCWGANGDGQLGNRTTVDSYTPTEVYMAEGRTASNWREIDVGDRYACGVFGDRDWRCWGMNDFQQLHQKNPTPFAPKAYQIEGGSVWSSPAVGDAHSCSIINNNVYCIGKNADTQVGGELQLPQYTAPPSYGTVQGPRKSDNTFWPNTGSDAQVQVAAGANHTCYRTQGGKLYCAGNNASGQLGLGNTNTYKNFQELTGWRGWLDVATGGNSTCARNGGNLYCWGANDSGQLGIGSVTNQSSPYSIGARPPNWTSVKVGTDHTCATHAEGLYCWGSNALGQLGSSVDAGTSTPRTSPLRISDQTWQKVDAGYSASCGILDGRIFCWGSNFYGQLGNGSSSQYAPAPTKVDKAYAWDVVAAGTTHACGISRGELYCWGFNGQGQLGTGTANEPNTSSKPLRVQFETGYTAVAAGSLHTCAIRSGKLYCWGNNGSGQLGLGDTTPRAVPARVGSYSDWTRVVARQDTTCGIRAATLYCWGNNDLGQVGDWSQTNRLAPVQIGSAGYWTAATVGYEQSCGIRGGQLWCWGDNSRGQLGNGTNTNSLGPVRVGSATDWVQVAAGQSMTCGRRGETLYCWGYGYLGNGAYTSSTSPVQVGSDTGWHDLALGNSTVCGLRQQKLYCWGFGGSAQLGLGDMTNRPVPTAVEPTYDWKTIAMGIMPACGITSGGGLLCWGNNMSLSLGTGDAEQHLKPTGVLGSGGWTQVTAQFYSMACGIAGGRALCWGRGYSQALGQGSDVYTSYEPRPILPLTPSANLTQIAGGNGNVACALSDGGGVYCWGDNGVGQLGRGTTGVPQDPGPISWSGAAWTAIAVGGSHVCGLAGGRAYCWGAGGSGQLGNGGTSNVNVPTQVSGNYTTWTAIAANGDTTCGVRGGQTFCWGSNAGYRLAIGNSNWSTNKLTPTAIASDPGFSQVFLGAYSGCGIGSGKLYCWGFNSSGELGDGTTTNRTSRVQVGTATDWTTVSPSNGSTTCGIRGGELYCWGAMSNWTGMPNSSLTPVKLGSATDWTSISMGGDGGNQCGVRGGALYCWGRNKDGNPNGTSIDGRLGFGLYDTPAPVIFD